MTALEIHFRIGEAFRSDNILSRYVATVGIILNDLVLESSHMLRAAASGARGSASEHLHFFRLTAARLREAAKAMDLWEREPDVAAFIGSLADEDREAYQNFKSSYTPWGNGETFVERYIVPLRNSVVFHYPEPGEDSLPQALTELAGTESTVYALSDSLADLRCEFADELANMLAFGGFNVENREELRTRIKELSIYVTSLIAFWHAVISRYLAMHVKEGTARRVI